MVQDFAVFLIICISGGSLGTTTSPQQQNTATLQDLCKVRNDYFTKLQGCSFLEIAIRRFARQHLHSAQLMAIIVCKLIVFSLCLMHFTTLRREALRSS